MIVWVLKWAFVVLWGYAAHGRIESEGWDKMILKYSMEVIIFHILEREVKWLDWWYIEGRADEICWWIGCKMWK